MIKSSLFKKPTRKSRFLKYVHEFISSCYAKLAPVPVSTCSRLLHIYNHQAIRVHLTEGTYVHDKSGGMAVEHMFELLTP